MRVFVVIPAYNEASRVGDTVRAIFALGQFSPPLQVGDQEGVRVVVIDDGSEDGTADAAQFAGATVLRHAVNRGQGASLQTGTAWALEQGADCIVHFDADGQFDAADIPRAVRHLNERGVDIVLGSRMLQLSSRAEARREPESRDLTDEISPLASLGRNDALCHIPATKRYMLLPIARLVNWAFTGVWLTDAHNGFRAFSRRAAEQIVIHHDRMAHNTDIVAQIRERGISFAEMPIRVRYNRYGQGLGGGVKIVADLLVGWFL
ncbi:MAG: glycosyltransferase family 2 protein [Patescibacteria group bacterium]